MVNAATAAPAAQAPAAPAAAADPKAPAPGAGSPAGGAAPAAPAKGAGDGAADPKAPVTGQEIAAAARKLKLILDGKEQELPEEEVVKLAQKAKGAEQRFEQAAKIKKHAEQLIDLLKRDPRAVLMHPSLGHDVRKLAEGWLGEILNLEKMTPEQREAHDNKEKIKKFEAEKQDQERTATEKRREQLQEHYRGELEKDIIGALDTAKLPKSPSTIKRMAYYLHEGLVRGIPVKAADVVELVKQDYMNEFKELFGGTDAEIMANIIGDDGMKKIREHDLARLRNPGAPAGGTNPPATPPATGANGNGKREPLSKEEFRQKMKRIEKGLE